MLVQPDSPSLLWLGLPLSPWRAPVNTKLQAHPQTACSLPLQPPSCPPYLLSPWLSPKATFSAWPSPSPILRSTHNLTREATHPPNTQSSLPAAHSEPMCFMTPVTGLRLVQVLGLPRWPHPTPGTKLRWMAQSCGSSELGRMGEPSVHVSTS